MRLMTPPLPAASRPSKMTTTLSLRVDDPVLQLHELALQPEQLPEIELPVEKACVAVAITSVEKLFEPASSSSISSSSSKLSAISASTRADSVSLGFFLLVHDRP